MTFGEKLRFCRTAEGYSQKTVADLLGVERSTYAYYETGKTQPSLQDTLRLAKLYGITMEMLVSEEYTPEGAEDLSGPSAKKFRISPREEPLPASETRSCHRKNTQKI